jgi:superfamily II RNA helicase
MSNTAADAQQLSSFLTVKKPGEPCTEWPPADPLSREYKYELDHFQKHAITAIHRDQNVLVTAKTGSGKTLVGEYQIAHSLARGRRVFYTTPIKSLSNQKFNDLKAIFPSVGIMTGDIKFQPQAQVVILTTEILRNLLYKRGTVTESLGLSGGMSLDGLDAVIFDEVHYINNPERGKVWEETMILLPPEVKLILLSATIDRPELFASWLGDLRQRPITLIPTTHRIVPLTHAVFSTQTGDLKTIMDAQEVFHDKVYRDWLAEGNATAAAVKAHRQRVEARDSDVVVARAVNERSYAFTNRLNSIVKFLRDREALPALFFCFSRRGCEEHAFRIEESLITACEAADVRHILRFHLRDHMANLEHLPQFHALQDLTAKGIAFHHSGLIPILKEAVEILFSRGLIRALFCTETFAVGINMPTKTAVFLGLKKFDDRTDGKRLITTDEYIQMAGRAGRRGLDSFGLVVYFPEDDPVTCAELKTVMKSGMPSITSRMDFGYDFILKTMHAGEGRWLDIMKQSYWYVQADRRKAQLERDITELQAKQAAVGISAEDLAAFKDKAGLEAAARLSRSKDAIRAVDHWKNRHVGPKWVAAERLYKVYKEYDEDIASARKHIAAMEKIMEGSELVDTSIQFLREMDYIGTDRAIIATELNEAHPILTTELYMSGLMNTLTQDELCILLSAFIEPEKNSWGFRVPHEVADAVQVALRKLGMIAREASELESGLRGARSDPAYWQLSAKWPVLMERYFGLLENGSDVTSAVTAVCTDAGMYEGNFIRGILKIANMLEELQGVATYMKNIEMLRTLEGATARLVTGLIVPDSLYLRLGN